MAAGDVAQSVGSPYGEHLQWQEHVRRPSSAGSGRSNRSWADIEDDEDQVDAGDGPGGPIPRRSELAMGSGSEMVSSDASVSSAQRGPGATVKVKKLHNQALRRDRASSGSGANNSSRSLRGPQGLFDHTPVTRDESEMSKMSDAPQFLSFDDATSSAGESPSRAESGAEQGLGETHDAGLGRQSAHGFPSAGSMKHEDGSCRVCLFVNTLLGCNKGVDCEFCHFQHKRSDGRPRACKGKRERYKKLVEMKMGTKDPEEEKSIAADSATTQASTVISLAESLQ